MGRYPAEEIHSQMDALLPWRDAPDWQLCSDTLWHSNVTPLLSRVQCVPWKHTPHHRTTTTSLQCWHTAWWMHVLLWFSPYPSQRETAGTGIHQTMQFFTILQCPVFSSLHPLKPQVLIFLLKEVELIHHLCPRYDNLCILFWDFWHQCCTGLSKLINCSPSVALHNLCQPPLASFISEPFLTTGLPLAGCPLGAGPFLKHTGNCWVWKTQQRCSSWYTQTSAPGTYYLEVLLLFSLATSVFGRTF